MFLFSESLCQESSRLLPRGSIKGTNNYGDDLAPFPFYQCPVCSANFHDKSTLKCHLSEVHGHQMPHTCSLCGKGYQTSSGLKSHMEAHQGKTFSCPICDVKLSQISAVRRHMKSRHKSAQCLTCRNIYLLAQIDQHVCLS